MQCSQRTAGSTARDMAHCTARMLASTTSMPTSDTPVMACASSTQPSNTAVTGLSNPSDDTRHRRQPCNAATP